MPTRKIVDLLDEDHKRFSPLQKLLKSSANHRRWTQELRALLDSPLAGEIEVTDVRGNHLYVLCASSAAATRLRFLLPDIVPELRKLAGFSGVTEVKIRVAAGNTAS